jgi:hypothetical protein
MGRKLKAAEAAAHARFAEDCGFTHLTWVDQPSLSRVGSQDLPEKRLAGYELGGSE